MFVLKDGLAILLQVGFLAAWQLQEGGQAMQVGHLVKGAQQEVHHHQTQEQVDWREGQSDRVTRRPLFKGHNYVSLFHNLQYHVCILKVLSTTALTQR